MADVITLNEIEEIKSLLQTNGVNTDANVTTLLERIGTTAQTGGTTTSGTVMAKLNTLLAANTNHGSVSYSTAGTYTWTCPAGVSQVFVLATGGSGGGGGGGGSYYGGYYYERNHAGAGGGSGGTSDVVWAIIPVSPTKAYTLKIGAAGSAGAAGVNETDSVNISAAKAGGAGGATKFGSLLTVNGGSGGAAGGNGVYSNSAHAAGGTGGNAGVLSSKKIYIVNYEAGIAGNKGGDSSINQSYDDGTVYTFYYGSGGNSPSNFLGFAGGKGGNGGNSLVSPAVTPKAGSKGVDGYMLIMW